MPDPTEDQTETIQAINTACAVIRGKLEALSFQLSPATMIEYLKSYGVEAGRSGPLGVQVTTRLHPSLYTHTFTLPDAQVREAIDAEGSGQAQEDNEAAQPPTENFVAQLPAYGAAVDLFRHSGPGFCTHPHDFTLPDGQARRRVAEEPKQVQATTHPFAGSLTVALLAIEGVEHAKVERAGDHPGTFKYNDLRVSVGPRNMSDEALDQVVRRVANALIGALAMDRPGMLTFGEERRLVVLSDGTKGTVNFSFLTDPTDEDNDAKP